MKRALITLSIILTAIIAGGVAWYIYSYSLSKDLPGEVTVTKKQETETAIDTARRSVIKGDVTTAIPILEKSVTTSVDKSQEAMANLNLGAAYLRGGLVDKGINLLKEVSINNSYPGGLRSTAAQTVLEYYLGGTNIDFALNSIFSGPVWGDFMKGATRDAAGLKIATINTLEWITTLAPSFPAEYTLASKYAERILETTNAEKRKADAALVLSHVHKGDIAYDRAIQQNAEAFKKDPNAIPPFFDFRLGVGLEHKGVALAVLYEIKEPTVSLESVETVFKDALTLLEKDPSQKGTLVSGLFTRYHLAVLLAHADPQKYAEEIKSTLTPVYNPSMQDTVFYQGFLKQYGSDPRYYNTKIWSNLVLLAKVDSRLKDLLINLGWKDSAFK